MKNFGQLRLLMCARSSSLRGDSCANASQRCCNLPLHLPLRSTKSAERRTDAEAENWGRRHLRDVLIKDILLLMHYSGLYNSQIISCYHHEQSPSQGNPQ